jgi:galactitol-specific phosphotransferase system IIB component
MRKILGIVACLALLCGCGVGSGTVVYEKVGDTWQVKEVHLEMRNIDSGTIKNGLDSLNEYAK